MNEKTKLWKPPTQCAGGDIILSPRSDPVNDESCGGEYDKTLSNCPVICLVNELHAQVGRQCCRRLRGSLGCAAAAVQWQLPVTARRVSFSGGSRALSVLLGFKGIAQRPSFSPCMQFVPKHSHSRHALLAVHGFVAEPRSISSSWQPRGGCCHWGRLCASGRRDRHSFWGASVLSPCAFLASEGGCPRWQDQWWRNGQLLALEGAEIDIWKDNSWWWLK